MDVCRGVSKRFYGSRLHVWLSTGQLSCPSLAAATSEVLSHKPLVFQEGFNISLHFKQPLWAQLL